MMVLARGVEPEPQVHEPQAVDPRRAISLTHADDHTQTVWQTIASCGWAPILSTASTPAVAYTRYGRRRASASHRRFRSASFVQGCAEESDSRTRWFERDTLGLQCEAFIFAGRKRDGIDVAHDLQRRRHYQRAGELPDELHFEL